VALCLCNCEIIPELTGEPAVGFYLMFVGRFVAAKCYSLLFVLVRGSSFWSGIVADIPFCVSYLSLIHSLTQTLALFLVLQYLVSCLAWVLL